MELTPQELTLFAASASAAGYFLKSYLLYRKNKAIPPNGLQGEIYPQEHYLFENRYVTIQDVHQDYLDIHLYEKTPRYDQHTIEVYQNSFRKSAIRVTADQIAQEVNMQAILAAKHTNDMLAAYAELDN